MSKGLISDGHNKQNLPMFPPDAQVPGNVCIIINSSCIFYVKLFHQGHKDSRVYNVIHTFKFCFSFNFWGNLLVHDKVFTWGITHLRFPLH